MQKININSRFSFPIAEFLIALITASVLVAHVRFEQESDTCYNLTIRYTLRWYSPLSWFLGLYTLILPPDEILEEIEISIPKQQKDLFRFPSLFLIKYYGVFQFGDEEV